VSALLTVLLQGDFLDRGSGPSSSGDFEISPNTFILLFGFGFLLGIFGHLFKSKTMVAAGVVLIFLSTVLLPIFISASR
jgi:hypothetical protein